VTRGVLDDPDVNLTYELLSRRAAGRARDLLIETVREQRRRRHRKPRRGGVALNDLNWYLVPLRRRALVREPSVSTGGSRDLAREVRDGTVPGETDQRLKVFRLVDGSRPVEPSTFGERRANAGVRPPATSTRR